MNSGKEGLQDMITVTKPNMPPLSEFVPYLEEIWSNKVLTNNGPFHLQLEKELAKYLKVPYISLFSNATIALIIAMQSLRLQGEIITTPYTFVATAHSIIWNNLKPVFVDVDPITGNLDPDLIEEAITSKTSAIMPVHIYGRPCNTEAIGNVANRYGLKVIYDAAHAFAVEDSGGSVLRHGDLSVLSFHATKVFNTFEGGAIVCKDETIKQRLDFLKNFGFADEFSVVAPGINGKMNELQAAFGLLQLKKIDQLIEKRAQIDYFYRECLSTVVGLTLFQKVDYARHNYSYFPILVNEHHSLSRDALYTKLKNNGVYARKYFYPLVSNMKMYKNFPGATSINLPNANALSERILCLPIYPDLTIKDLEYIVELVK